MSAKKRRFTSILNSFLRAFFLFVIFVCLNSLIAPKHFTRVDLTRDKLYTITDATKSLVEDLSDNLIIRGYFSEELPHAYAEIPIYVKDILREYEAYGKGRVEIEVVDPARDEKVREFVTGLGIQPFKLQDRDRDKLVVRNCYMSLAVFHLDQHEVLPDMTQMSSLEYELSRAIVKVTKRSLPSIGLLVDSQAVAPAAPNQQGSNPGFSFEMVFQTLQTQYKVQKVHVQSGQKIPENIGTLLIVRPRDLSEREAFEIDQFVMRGGKLAVFVDTVTFDLTKNLAEVRVQSGLEDLLAHYGFRVRDELVLDENHFYIPVLHRQGMMQLQQNLPYPYYLKINKEDIDKTNPVVKKIGNLLLFWASPLEILDDQVNGREVVELVHSSDKAWSATEYDNVFPSTEGGFGYYRRPDEKNRESFLLAAVQIGEFDSFYKGKEVPEVKKPETPSSPGRSGGIPPGLQDQLPPGFQMKGAPGGQAALEAAKKKAAEAAKKSEGLKEKPEDPPPAPPSSLFQDDGPQPLPNKDPVAQPETQTEEDPAHDHPEDEASSPSSKKPIREIIERSPETRILVITDADMVADANFRNAPCYTFVQNTVDWMTLGNELIEIRSRGVEVPTIEEVPESKAFWIKLLTIGGVPFFVLALGFVRWILRSS